MPAGRPEKPPPRKWYPTPQNDAFIEALYAADPQKFDQSALTNMLYTMMRVLLKGSPLDALTSTSFRYKRQERENQAQDAPSRNRHNMEPTES